MLRTEQSAFWCRGQTLTSIHFGGGWSLWKLSNPLSVWLSCGVLDWSGDVLTSCEIKGNWSMAFLIGSRRVPAASNPLGLDDCPQPSQNQFFLHTGAKISSLTWSYEATLGGSAQSSSLWKKKKKMRQTEDGGEEDEESKFKWRAFCTITYLPFFLLYLMCIFMSLLLIVNVSGCSCTAPSRNYLSVKLSGRHRDVFFLRFSVQSL